MVSKQLERPVDVKHMGVYSFQRDLNHIDLDGFIVYGIYTIANESVLLVTMYSPAMATSQFLISDFLELVHLFSSIVEPEYEF